MHVVWFILYAVSRENSVGKWPCCKEMITRYLVNESDVMVCQTTSNSTVFQKLIQANRRENIIGITGPLWREFTGHSDNTDMREKHDVLFLICAGLSE